MEWQTSYLRIKTKTKRQRTLYLLYSKNNPRLQQAHRKIALPNLQALVKVKALKLLLQLRVKPVRLLHLLKVKTTIKQPLQPLQKRKTITISINCQKK